MTLRRFVVAALLGAACSTGISAAVPSGAQTAPPNHIGIKVVAEGIIPRTFAPEFVIDCSTNGGPPFDHFEAKFDLDHPYPQSFELAANDSLCGLNFALDDGVPAGVPYEATLTCAVTPDLVPPGCSVGNRPPFAQFQFLAAGGGAVTVVRTFVFAIPPPPPIEIAPTFTG